MQAVMMRQSDVKQHPTAEATVLYKHCASLWWHVYESLELPST
jgi:hypothetical protein